MPIGFDRGDLVGGGVVTNAGERAIEEHVREVVEQMRALALGPGRVWTRWETAEDERVCPECGPLDGLAWPAEEGPAPPLHNHCRCRRTFAFMEWGSRDG